MGELPERSSTLCAECSSLNSDPNPCAGCDLKKELEALRRRVEELEDGR